MKHTSLKQHKKTQNSQTPFFLVMPEKTQKTGRKACSFHDDNQWVFSIGRIWRHPSFGTWTSEQFTQPREELALPRPFLEKKAVDLVIGWMTEIDGRWIFWYMLNLFVVLFGWQEGIGGTAPHLSGRDFCFDGSNDMISRCLFWGTICHLTILIHIFYLPCSSWGSRSKHPEKTTWTQKSSNNHWTHARTWREADDLSSNTPHKKGLRSTRGVAGLQTFEMDYLF